MATIPQTWSICLCTVITVLAVQFCIGHKSCIIWSSAGLQVELGSSFVVYCTLNCKCKGSMYAENTYKPQDHKELNSTTMYLDVVNITKDRTYSCQCNNCRPAPDPCGLDIQTGYPPDVPANIKCIQHTVNGEEGVVVCTWNRGRDTYFQNSAKLWVRTTSGNQTEHTGSSNKGSDLLSASFNVSSSVQGISVWVHTHNPLGSVKSTTFNFTLSDIVMPFPPVLGQVECSSRVCEVKVGQSPRTQHLEIQYSTEQQAWRTHPDSGGQTSSVRVQISSLEPYRRYYFRARAKFSTGLWSQWSTNISTWTQEEAPDKELDVWHAEPSELNPMTVYWKPLSVWACGVLAIVAPSDRVASLVCSTQTKEQTLTTFEKLNDFNARGKIVEYMVKVRNLNTGSISISRISANASHTPVQSCANCEVTLLARNSKGLSPPAIIPVLHKRAKPPQDVRVTVSNHGVAISWRKPETAFLPTAYLVEWYPEEQKLQELQWFRLGRNETHAVITDMEPFECYEGAVYVFYENSVGTARFMGVSTLESAPTQGPSVQEQVEGDRVTVTWTEVPRGQRRGCITNYTIYIKNTEDSNFQKSYHLVSSEKMHIINNLPPASYSLWMTAWTAHGEGPAGETVKFFIQSESSVFLPLVYVFTFLVLAVLGLWQVSAVKQRLCMFFHCLMLEDVPDPANSKWARECAKQKDRKNLQLQLSNSSLTEEEEPNITEVEELHEESSNSTIPEVAATDAFSPLLPQLSPSPTTEPATLLYTQTSYIKSFSHDSDSSDHTHSSLETNTTDDYISSHGPGNGLEYEEDETECMDVLGFFPSRNILKDPLVFGGTLTLDAVKIDCSGFFGNGQWSPENPAE